MGIFNIIWGSVAVVVILSMYFNCKYIIKGNKNIIIGVTIPNFINSNCYSFYQYKRIWNKFRTYIS